MIDYLKGKKEGAPKTLMEKFKIIKKNIGMEVKSESDNDMFMEKSNKNMSKQRWRSIKATVLKTMQL